MRRKRSAKKGTKRSGPNPVRLIIAVDWQDAMKASVVKDRAAKGYRKK